MLEPNDYKPQIEQLVEDRTRLDLTLGGDIDWSLFPLGLELNAVDAQLDGEPLLKLERALARVSLWSLLRMQPAVHSFVLNGLELNLVRDEQGRGNWERIMRDDKTADKAPAGKPEKQQPERQRDLVVSAREIDIEDARLHYRDRGSGQTLLLDQFSLQATDIAPGRSFPLKLSFHFAIAEPALDVRADLDGAFSVDQTFQRVVVDGLSSELELSGAPFNGRTVPATLKGDLTADLERQTASLNDLVVTLANLTVNADLDARGPADSPQLSGKLAAPAFSPRELLKQLGQPAVPSRDPTTLNKLSFEATLGGEPGLLTLEPLNVNLDESTLKGRLTRSVSSGKLEGRLQLDRLNVDRYLPPEPATPDEQTQESPATAAPESDLLPLDTLRGLHWDLRLDVGELIASNITVTEATLSTTAADGAIAVKPLSGRLYEGSFNATANIDAAPDTPTWQAQGKLENVKTLPLLTDAADVRQFSGLANLSFDLKSRGNRVSALRSNAKGQAQVDIAEGKFEGTSMAALACQGIALANRERIDTSTWPKETGFEALTGTLAIDGNTINNTGLKAQIKGMALEGRGTVDAQQMTLDYKAGLRILGAVHEDPACRVNERLTGVVIPVKCEGPLAGEDGLPCKFDSARFRDTLKDMAAAEAKQKIEAEKERAREKLRDKAREKFESFFE